MKVCVLIASLFASQLSLATELLVTVSGGSNDGKGKIVARLFNSKEGFPTGKAQKELSLKTKDSIEFKFTELEPGTYAVMVFLDENSNGKFDRNWIGIPKEKVAVSNNAKGSVGPPSYSDAKFEIHADESKKISIQLMDPKERKK